MMRGARIGDSGYERDDECVFSCVDNVILPINLLCNSHQQEDGGSMARQHPRKPGGPVDAVQAPSSKD